MFYGPSKAIDYADYMRVGATWPSTVATRNLGAPTGGPRCASAGVCAPLCWVPRGTPSFGYWLLLDRWRRAHTASMPPQSHAIWSLPAPSRACAVHWSQMAESASGLRHFDYGTNCSRVAAGEGGGPAPFQESCNQAKYGQLSPPAYDLRNIRAKVALFQGGPAGGALGRGPAESSGAV